MARRDQLRRQRTGTIINATSKQQESELIKALKRTALYLDRQFPYVAFHHAKLWNIADIVRELASAHPHVDFHHHFNNTSIKPDGGTFASNPKRTQT